MGIRLAFNVVEDRCPCNTQWFNFGQVRALAVSLHPIETAAAISRSIRSRYDLSRYKPVPIPFLNEFN
jgi:hypothetical protein